MIEDEDSQEYELRSYGRRRGRKPSARQATLLRDSLPRVAFDPAETTQACATWLEIGFGGGEHLVHMCARYPGVNIIGCEPFINGVAMLLGKIRAAGVTNIAVYPGDARDLMEVLPDRCLERAFLNYPDPWPKSRHHRRRFVTPEHLIPLARVMKPGAEFRVATDIPDYVRQTLEEVPPAGFDLVAEGPEAWDDWLSTRYEQKALREGRVPHYVTFRRQG